MKVDMDVMDDVMKLDATTEGQQASFTRMQDGSLDDWKIIGAAHKQDFGNTADRFIGMLRQLENATLGFACDQLQHALMCATLARRSGASPEHIVIALCHDIAKVINVPNHGPIAAEMMRPYISDDSYHVIYHHQAFQGEHYYHYLARRPICANNGKMKAGIRWPSNSSTNGTLLPLIRTLKSIVWTVSFH